MTSQDNFSTTLFYSYSHKDSRHREDMEQALALLRRDGILKEWSDRNILPGQSIPRTIEATMNTVDIFAFLLSPAFLNSTPCFEEWSRAMKIAMADSSRFCVPIVLEHCSWRDLDGMSDLMALPIDARPVEDFPNKNVAWKQVYDGLKSVVEKLRSTFTIRGEFMKEIDETGFLSQDNISLRQIFVFPVLSSYSTKIEGIEARDRIVTSESLLSRRFTLIHGEQSSGKTALCRYMMRNLVDESKPVLLIDLDNVPKKAKPHNVWKQTYHRQFTGDYELWKQKDQKSIILDNLSESPHMIRHVEVALKCFDRVIITASTDIFLAYFRDDARFAEFLKARIDPLTHSKQEELIRKRMRLGGQKETLSDGIIDQIEGRVNDVIISNRILPRYPFYVLSILQTYEGFMKKDLSITSYGHCYFVLIMAHLAKSGIPMDGGEIDACMNFAECLAFEIYSNNSGEQCIGSDALGRFVEGYKKKYLLRDSTLSRMLHKNFGIVLDVGCFRQSYMYYYFLGKHLAKNQGQHSDVLGQILEQSYVGANCLTLIFTIHHITDTALIDDILRQTVLALDTTDPSTFKTHEVRIFDDIVDSIPTDILTEQSTAIQRKKERDVRDQSDLSMVEIEPQSATQDVNDIYRIMKNNEILSQIIKNKYGSLGRDKLVNIVEAIIDGGLKLVKLVLGQQDEINKLAIYIHEEHPDLGIDDIKLAIGRLSFYWAMLNVGLVVSALNKPEIKEIVEEVVSRRASPAFDIVGYFYRLDTLDEFQARDRNYLRGLWDKYRYNFMRRVISLRTQHYLNTHNVGTPLEQSVCMLLGIKYRPRIKEII